MRSKNIVRPRKFKAYCVGTAKSGTHSLADVFSKNYRAQHEPEGQQLIYLKAQLRQGNITKLALLDFLKNRDIRTNLEMESSDFACYFVSEFVELDPQAKFILPIRDCYSFFDSIIK